MRIGLFGGSFNPIHNGHVMLGELMLEHAGLDEVWYVVSPLNPLKNDGRNQEAEETRLRRGRCTEGQTTTEGIRL